MLAFAIGVASFSGVTYWLVGPGYSSAGVTVNGQVMAGRNAAVGVANAWVYVTYASTPQMSFQVYTNADGAFSFDAYYGGMYTMYAYLGTAWGSATSQPVTKTMPEGPGTVDVTLIVPASNIEGTVTAASTGLPIPGVAMALSDSIGNQWCCSTTLADGSYVLWTLTSGAFTVTAMASGYNQASAVVYINGTADSATQNFQLS